MKKFLLPSALLIASLVTSCNKFDADDNYIALRTYATAVADANQDCGISFIADTDESFYISSNQSKTDLSKIPDGKRIITGVRLYNSKVDGYDFRGILYETFDVLVGKTKTITTEQEHNDLSDNVLSSLYSKIDLSLGYLNILATYFTNNPDNVNFYLVENLYDIADNEDSKYLDLELRYDAATDAAITGDELGENVREYEDYISFDMRPYFTQMQDKTGIRLRIYTEKSNVIYIKVPAHNLYDEDDL